MHPPSLRQEEHLRSPKGDVYALNRGYAGARLAILVSHSVQRHHNDDRVRHGDHDRDHTRDGDEHVRVDLERNPHANGM